MTGVSTGDRHWVGQRHVSGERVEGLAHGTCPTAVTSGRDGVTPSPPLPSPNDGVWCPVTEWCVLQTRTESAAATHGRSLALPSISHVRCPKCQTSDTQTKPGFQIYSESQ